MNYTTNYHLPQWVETDRLLMDDFNEAYSAIDAALDGLQSSVDGNTTSIAGKGNCQIYAASYVGTDTTSVTHTFPKLPRLVVVMGDGGLVLTIQGADNGLHRGANGIYSTLSVSWSGNSVTWSGQNAFELCNLSSETYALLALLEA